MTVCEKAVRTFGFEDSRTVAICILVENGHKKVAERLFETLTDGGKD